MIHRSSPCQNRSSMLRHGSPAPAPRQWCRAMGPECRRKDPKPPDRSMGRGESLRPPATPPPRPPKTPHRPIAEARPRPAAWSRAPPHCRFCRCRACYPAPAHRPRNSRCRNTENRAACPARQKPVRPRRRRKCHCKWRSADRSPPPKRLRYQSPAKRSDHRPRPPIPTCRTAGRPPAPPPAPADQRSKKRACLAKRVAQIP